MSLHRELLNFYLKTKIWLGCHWFLTFGVFVFALIELNFKYKLALKFCQYYIRFMKSYTPNGSWTLPVNNMVKENIVIALFKDAYDKF